MRLATILAISTAILSAIGYFKRGLIMEPDFHLYTQGGFGIFPSPIGRLLGSFGPTPFAIASILASGLCVYLIALAAHKRECNSALAAATFALWLPMLYLTYAGIDPIGLALLLAAIAGVASSWTLPAAALTHLSLVPFALLKLPRSLAARLAFATVAFCTVAALLMTPYSGVIFGIFHEDALKAMALGFGVAVLFSAPALLFTHGLPGPWVAAVIIGVLECGAQHHLQARYLIPAAAMAAIHVRVPAFAQGGFTNSRPNHASVTGKS